MFYRPHDRVFAEHSEEMLTKQAFKDECDINRILKNYNSTGTISHFNTATGSYADLPEATDFQQALETVRQANEAFNELPSAIRQRFNNDPTALLAAVHDPDQWPVLQELGVLERPPAAPPGRAELLPDESSR